MNMHNYKNIEKWYRKFIDGLDDWINQENMAVVNIELLHALDLLDYEEEEVKDPSMYRRFHSIETSEKITLLNEDFIIWIISEAELKYAATYTLIAKNHHGTPQLEFVFVSSGVYNTSKTVLRVLEKYLSEIEENEALIKQLKGS
jgi:hypothetical protein